VDPRSTVISQTAYPFLLARYDSIETQPDLGANQPMTRSLTTLIDRIRHDIQQRLDQLLAEADKLRHALAALDPRQHATHEPKSTKSQPTPPRTVKTSDTPTPTPARARPRSAGKANAPSAPPRTAPGQTKATVLAALSTERALTASQVASATGLARPTVSTTLSRLSKTGDVVKADRGYRLPGANGRTG
jgi:DNA-binding transcriptional ArsR family regulator